MRPWGSISDGPRLTIGFNFCRWLVGVWVTWERGQFGWHNLMLYVGPFWASMTVWNKKFADEA